MLLSLYSDVIFYVYNNISALTGRIIYIMRVGYSRWWQQANFGGKYSSFHGMSLKACQLADVSFLFICYNPES